MKYTVLLALTCSFLLLPLQARAVDRQTIDFVIEAHAERIGMDANLAKKIAWCESGYQEKVVSRTGDRGIYQLNGVHDRELKKLDLDPFNFQENIEFAFILMERNGVRDWYSSRHCWSKTAYKPKKVARKLL